MGCGYFFGGGSQYWLPRYSCKVENHLLQDNAMFHRNEHMKYRIANFHHFHLDKMMMLLMTMITMLRWCWQRQHWREILCFNPQVLIVLDSDPRSANAGVSDRHDHDNHCDHDYVHDQVWCTMTMTVTMTMIIIMIMTMIMIIIVIMTMIMARSGAQCSSSTWPG